MINIKEKFIEGRRRRRQQHQHCIFPEYKYLIQQQHHQQSLRKHTLPDSVAHDKLSSSSSSSTFKSSPMKSTTTTTSVFSSYTKEEPYQRMQLKQKQPQQQPQQKQQQNTTMPPSGGAATEPLTTRPVHIPYNIDWVFAKLKNPSGFWSICSHIAVFCVGLFSKIVLVFMNKTRVHNKERLLEAVCKRPPGVPLVTVSNHHSCFDDPGLWGILPMHYFGNTFKVRWSMAAHDICFTNKYHALFFMFGKCIPVIRGVGVYQDAINICIQKVKLGQWVHVFPEGKVNMSKEEMRLKWGVGRIIYESPHVPVILPMWHEGMDEVLPNVEPYILKWRKKVTLNVGKPLDLNDFIKDLKYRGVPEPEARKLITDKIQDVFHDLRLETEELHKKHK